jgi:Superfamily II DNA and RNA helicases
VPIINHLSTLDKKVTREDGTYCFVICPTRELCVQVVKAAQILLKSCISIVCGEIMVISLEIS